MIRRCVDVDFDVVYGIVNDAAQAYKGVIPADRYHEPYMSRGEIAHEIGNGIIFWGYEENGVLLGVMGIQDKGDVSLIRHAYVRTINQGKGIGGKLLSFLIKQTDKPVLVGTWVAATWAVSFYEKYGFVLVERKEKDFLLKKYWGVPERQIETSVVLADDRWLRCSIARSLRR
jgi:GNAT superfamily N-acetyltransferase